MSHQRQYKSEAIYNLLTYVKNKFPHASNIIEQYEPAFRDINLSQTNGDYSNGEIYMQTLNLVTSETIYLFWNIDAVIQHIEKFNITPQVISPNMIMHNPQFILPTFESTLKRVQKNKTKFIHKTDYIIFAELPCFPGMTIIDGNHRFCEALINKQNIKAYFILPTGASQFLQPDSQKFIILFAELINKIDAL